MSKHVKKLHEGHQVLHPYAGGKLPDTHIVVAEVYELYKAIEAIKQEYLSNPRIEPGNLRLQVDVYADVEHEVADGGGSGGSGTSGVGAPPSPPPGAVDPFGAPIDTRGF